MYLIAISEQRIGRFYYCDVTIVSCRELIFDVIL